LGNYGIGSYSGVTYEANVTIGTAPNVPVTLASITSTAGGLLYGVIGDEGCAAGGNNVFQGILGIGPPSQLNKGTTDWVTEARAPERVTLRTGPPALRTPVVVLCRLFSEF
jgi:anti-sigma factor RsiW